MAVFDRKRAFLVVYLYIKDNSVTTKNKITMKKQNRHSDYTAPMVWCESFACERGFAVTNDNLKEENWGWDE